MGVAFWVAALGGLALSACGRGGATPPRPATSAEPLAAGSRAMPPPAPEASGATRPSAPPTPVQPAQRLSRRPVLALYAVNPWAMVLGADVPSLVVYEDGSAIAARPPAADAKRARLVEGRLPGWPELRQRLRQALEPVPTHTTVWGATDQPTTLVLMDVGAGWLRRSVYGGLRDCRPAQPAPMQQVPPGFELACRLLTDVKLDAEQDYTPEWTEVLLWGYAHSPEVPAPWPSGVPSPPPVEPPKEGVVRHLVQTSRLGPLEQLLASLKPRQAVLLHGAKWSVALRVSLPGDAYLRDVNRATALAAAR